MKCTVGNTEVQLTPSWHRIFICLTKSKLFCGTCFCLIIADVVENLYHSITKLLSRYYHIYIYITILLDTATLIQLVSVQQSV
jgi:hypothetical protein